jgi:hypothetical protein
MNTTIPTIRSSSSSSSEPLCPLDERRTKTELLIKLCVVHFTTLSAFFHLLNIRGEYLLSPRPIFYICVPLSFIAQHVIAGAALILRIPLVCIRDRRFPDSESDIVRPVKWLTAKLKDGLIESGPRQITNSRYRLPERAARGLGHVLVTTAFIIQCSASLFLYHRRKTHAPESIALVDEKIFELAVSGALVAFLTLGVTLRIPGFRILNAAQGPRSRIEKIMICLGHRRAAATVCSNQGTIFCDWHISPVICFVALSIISCAVLHASGKVDPFQELHCIYIRFRFPDADDDCPKAGFLFTLDFMFASAAGGVAASSVMGLSIPFLADYVFLNRLIDHPRLSFCEEWIGYVWFLLCGAIMTPFFLIAIIFFFFVLFYPIYLIIGLFRVFSVGITDYSRIFTQLNEWQDWKEDVPCPVLWKDPMADLVWWLA